MILRSLIISVRVVRSSKLVKTQAQSMVLKETIKMPLRKRKYPDEQIAGVKLKITVLLYPLGIRMMSHLEILLSIER